MEMAVAMWLCVLSGQRFASRAGMAQAFEAGERQRLHLWSSAAAADVAALRVHNSGRPRPGASRTTISKVDGSSGRPWPGGRWQ